MSPKAKRAETMDLFLNQNIFFKLKEQVFDKNRLQELQEKYKEIYPEIEEKFIKNCINILNPVIYCCFDARSAPFKINKTCDILDNMINDNFSQEEIDEIDELNLNIFWNLQNPNNTNDNEYIDEKYRINFEEYAINKYNIEKYHELIKKISTDLLISIKDIIEPNNIIKLSNNKEKQHYTPLTPDILKQQASI